MPDEIMPSAGGPLRVGPADVGRRVSLRGRVGEPPGRRVHEPADGSPEGIPGRTWYSDVVGELLSWTGGVVRVRRRDGAVVQVAAADLVAGKVVPEAAVRPRTRAGGGPARISAEELEEVAARGWPALEGRWLGRWWLRAAGGFTGRANSALLLGDPGLPLPAAVAEVERWYGERGLAPRLLVVRGSRLDEELTAAGLRQVHSDEVLVQTAPIARVLALLDQLDERANAAGRGPGAGGPVPQQPVGLCEQPDVNWLRLYRGGVDRNGVLPPEVRHVLCGHDQVRFAAVGDPVAGGGRATVDGIWAGVAAVEIDPAHRRRGLGRLVMRALLSWAADHGAQHAYLQTTADNTPAVRLYSSLGFTTHHRYRYLAR